MITGVSGRNPSFPGAFDFAKGKQDSNRATLTARRDRLCRERERGAGSAGGAHGEESESQPDRTRDARRAPSAERRRTRLLFKGNRECRRADGT